MRESPLELRIDLHVHAVGTGNGSDCCIAESQKNGLLNRLLEKYLRLYGLSKNTPDAAYLEWIAWCVRESSLDRAVLLAFDGRYTSAGELDRENTSLYVPNEFVLDAAERYPELLAGVSINPKRKDALKELERCAERGAVLVKWVPATQDFNPGDEAYLLFYQKLAELDIALLSHTGIEHTLPVTHQDYNHPKYLIPVLEQGVKVIAVHCATSSTDCIEEQYLEFIRLSQEYPNFYGDIAAVGSRGRLEQLFELVPHKLIYGSDFPVPPLPSISPFTRFIAGLPRIFSKNPLERHVQLMTERNAPDSAFTLASRVLGL